MSIASLSDNYWSLLDHLRNILAAARTSFRARNVIIAARSAVHHLGRFERRRIFRCEVAMIRYLATSKDRGLFCYLVDANVGREFLVLISNSEVVTSYTRLASIIHHMLLVTDSCMGFNDAHEPASSSALRGRASQLLKASPIFISSNQTAT